MPTAVGPSTMIPRAPASCVPAKGVSIDAFVLTFTAPVVCTTSPILKDVALDTAARFEPEVKKLLI